MPERLEIDAITETFAEEGYVILRQLLDPSVAAEARAELSHWVDRQAQQLRDEGVIDQLFEDKPFETRLNHVFCNCRDRMPSHIRSELHWPGMFALFFDRRLLDIVENLLGPEIRLYPNYTVRPKLPDHAATQVLWHQDAGYTASGKHGDDPNADSMTVDQLRMINVWSPLVPARPENGCMKFIPRSHLLGVVSHATKEHYLEIVEQELQPRLNDAVDIAVDPGDVVLFSNMLFHMGQPNRSHIVRWSCDWRYQDATQSTMRSNRGHIARSRSNPSAAVRDPEHWASLSFV